MNDSLMINSLAFYSPSSFLPALPLVWKPDHPDRRQIGRAISRDRSRYLHRLLFPVRTKSLCRLLFPVRAAPGNPAAVRPWEKTGY